MSERCQVPPPGWSCSRKPGHSGPCCARPSLDSVSDAHREAADEFAARMGWEGFVFIAQSLPTLVAESEARGYAAGLKAGRVAERAAVVAWLTTKCVAYGDGPRCDDLVDAIERGDHDDRT